jgi:hypothetical protein
VGYSLKGAYSTKSVIISNSTPGVIHWRASVNGKSKLPSYSMDCTTYLFLLFGIMIRKFFKRTGFKQKFVFHEKEAESSREDPAT